MIFFLKLQGLFSDKGKSTKQVSLRTIMNTKIHVFLEIILDSFGMGKKITFPTVEDTILHSPFMQL